MNTNPPQVPTLTSGSDHWLSSTCSKSHRAGTWPRVPSSFHEKPWNGQRISLQRPLTSFNCRPRWRQAL